MKYYKITNSDGKQWVMPTHNMSVGMLLYQPSAWTGHMLKSLFPYLSWSIIVKRFLKVEGCGCPVSDYLQTLLCNIFHREDLEYSIFNGTPGVHQKGTIQIFQGNNILGYCKFSESEDIGDIFEREKVLLDRLNNKGVRGIPHVLYCGKIIDKYLFLQSTCKTINSHSSKNLGKDELNFLVQFEEKTKCRLGYLESDQFKSVERLKGHLHDFTLQHKNILKTLVEKVESYYFSRTDFEFSAFHSDFTPWNMFKENGELFVFDFEYARYSCMPYIDIFHYIIQTAMYEKQMCASNIYEYVKKKETEFGQFFENYRIAFITYLIDVIGFYAERESGHIGSHQKVRLEVAELVYRSFGYE